MKEKRIGIFGLGVTGESVFTTLDGADKVDGTDKEIICWDDSEDNRNRFQTKFEHSTLAPLSSPEWSKLDTIIISPGISKLHEVFSLAASHNILISSDVQLFIDNNPDSELIIITGTNGKSTTTALIGHILTCSGIDHDIGGNIGPAVLSLPKNKKYYVLELSSFQIDLLKKFEPAISVLLNLTPDHIDRHGSFDKYCAAKARIFDNDGLKIIGTNSDKSKELYEKLKKTGDKKIVPISSDEGINCTSDTITDNFFDRKSYHMETLVNLTGVHNCENIAAAFAVCRAMGLKAGEIIQHIKSFGGLKHRMQFLGNIENISFYNDSKATNTNSAASSISSLDNVLWLAGGVFKEDNLKPLGNSIKNIKKAYLFGESKLLFAEYLEGIAEYKIYDNMEKAFYSAVRDAKIEGESANILLAPACTSLDQFKNFEDRGERFIQLFEAIK
ncbi:MAG: UDP-N-acetylmuramoyl-L-alanine--D-glutamate ligase [Rickettsiales bacterium]|nr:MAG: UDP-N-acetylmuramoyl-L-alanine--D-glutamate ligase [Rickettsiales bacterium]